MLPRMLTHKVIGLGSGLLAKVGVSGDFATEECLQPPRKLPTIERERTVIPRTIPILRTIAYPGRVRAEVTIELLSAIQSVMTTI